MKETNPEFLRRLNQIDYVLKPTETEETKCHDAFWLHVNGDRRVALLSYIEVNYSGEDQGMTSHQISMNSLFKR